MAAARIVTLAVLIFTVGLPVLLVAVAYALAHWRARRLGPMTSDELAYLSMPITEPWEMDPNEP